MEDSEFNYINMVPFIDVMLVLLTIILLTSTFVVSGIIPVQLPKVKGTYNQIVRSTVVEIDQKGDVFYSGRPVSLDRLKGQLDGLVRATPFLIRADNHIPLQRFIEVLDLVKGMGFTQVSVQTEQNR
jgi:biopolymer transport protein ExbD